MKLNLWQVDAFAHAPFSGNPAAVVPLGSWLPDATMQAIAGENNLSETAFFVQRETGLYDLRWFTPVAEVELCGHATLASAFVVFSELAPELETVRFSTLKSGDLTVERGEDGVHRMALPADPVRPCVEPSGLREVLGKALSVPSPEEVHRGRNLLALWPDEANVRAIRLGDLERALRFAGRWGLIATAPADPGAPYDFVSRFFSIGYGIPEDPVTGSAHCALSPFWSARLGKKDLRGYQASARGGFVQCTDDGASTIIAGPCALYLKGEILV